MHVPGMTEVVSAARRMWLHSRAFGSTWTAETAKHTRMLREDWRRFDPSSRRVVYLSLLSSAVVVGFMFTGSSIGKSQETSGSGSAPRCEGSAGDPTCPPIPPGQATPPASSGPWALLIVNMGDPAWSQDQSPMRLIVDSLKGQCPHKANLVMEVNPGDSPNVTNCHGNLIQQ
jgi:hypothetical protein